MVRTHATGAVASAAPSSGEIAAAQVDCAGDLSARPLVSGQAGVAADPTYGATKAVCITIITWWSLAPVPAAGTASLTRDGVVVATIDLAHWDTTGVDGAGSGERLVTLATPIGIAAGQRLAMAFSGCSSCAGSIGAAFEGRGAPLLPATNT